MRDLELQAAKDALTLYIEPQGKRSLWATTTFDLTTEVRSFLATEDKKVLLLLGDAGSGKSTFNRAITRILWDNYTDIAPIPLFISLIECSRDRLIEHHLESYGFTASQIQTLKQERQFIFILDGYDEIQTDLNLYNDNQLWKWKAKVIISCRTEYLGKDYRQRFAPLDRNDISIARQLKELVVAPFSSAQINQYITNYVKCHTTEDQESEWDEAQYQRAFKQLPGLEPLLSNPFILKIAMTVLPSLAGQLRSSYKVTRLDLYDSFMHYWFHRAHKRLQQIRG